MTVPFQDQEEFPAEARPCRTLKNRGLDPLQTTLDALRTYATTGTLPPLPEKAISGG
jgi:hypothetical protein